MIQWVILYVGIVGLFSCVPLVVSLPVLVLVAWLAPRKTEKNLAYVIVLGTGSFSIWIFLTVSKKENHESFKTIKNNRDFQFQINLLFDPCKGDVGHSPRTYNQVTSLISTGKKVVLFGFRGSKLPESSLEHFSTGALKVVHIPQFKLDFISIKIAKYIFKTVAQGPGFYNNFK